MPDCSRVTYVHDFGIAVTSSLHISEWPMKHLLVVRVSFPF